MKRLMLSVTGCLLLGLMVQTTCTPTWLSAGEDEQAREVKAQFARQAGRIKSLAVTYRLETKSNLSPEKLRALPEYQNQLFLPQDEWREAFKGEKRFRRQIQPERVKYLVPLNENGLAIPAEPSSDASPAMKENQKQLRKEYERAVATTKTMEARGIRIPRRDPGVRELSEQDVTRAYNGKTLWMKQPASRTSDRYLIWPTGSEANWFQISAYLSAIGLHVPDPSGGDLVKKAQEMFRLAERIKDPSYALEPRIEIVDGSTCVILKGSLNSLLQPGLVVGQLTDRIWLDRDHGFVLRKREMYRDGTVMNRWENSKLKEIEPGLWLPMNSRHDQFPSKPVAELNGKPVLTEEITVQTLEVNHVADDRFDMEPKQADSIEDLRGKL